MENVIEKGLELVKQGVPFKVDLYEQSLKVGDKYLIKEGKLFQHKKILIGSIRLQDALIELERRYQYFKHSIPGANEPSRTYFKPLKFKDLTDEDRDFGMQRHVARYELEAWFLCLVISGSLYWNETIMGKGWFYKGKDPDFIILRSWIESSK